LCEWVDELDTIGIAIGKDTDGFFGNSQAYQTKH
jgi:hypothetical protein